MQLKPFDFLRKSFLSSSLIFLSAPWEKQQTKTYWTHHFVEQVYLEAHCAGETTRGRTDVMI